MDMIRFESSAGAAVTMSSELARTFIRMMGHRESVPGAVVAEDIPRALAQLRSRLDPASPAPESAAGDDRDDDPSGEPVPLSTRAFPLVSLLDAAARKDKDLLWEHFNGAYV